VLQKNNPKKEIYHTFSKQSLADICIICRAFCLEIRNNYRILITQSLILLWHFKLLLHETSPYPLQRGNCTNGNPPLKGVGGCFVYLNFEQILECQSRTNYPILNPPIPKNHVHKILQTLTNGICNPVCHFSNSVDLSYLQSESKRD
jgi:hypothetical protein